MKQIWHFGWIALPLILVYGCESCSSKTDSNPNDEGQATVNAPQEDSGLEKTDITMGEGEVATAGQIVEVHYTGSLVDGTEFDSSRSRGPFRFNLGAGEVIKGWDEGVQGMKIGGKRKLKIPAHLGYGPRGVPGVIPPNSVLIFEVELLSVQAP